MRNCLSYLSAFFFWMRDVVRRRVLRRQAFIAVSPTRIPSLAAFLKDRFSHGLVHAGLSRIESGSARSATDDILGELEQGLSYFCVPAFTPGFRQEKVFSSNESIPEVGTFSKLCMERRSPRTRDPIHSLFVFNDPAAHVMNLPVRDTFAPDGVYRSFVDPGSCWINIGTPDLVSTALHYIERIAQVPYLKEQVVSGKIIDESGNEEWVDQKSYRYRSRLCWNRKKIENHLREIGCVDYLQWRGALVRVVDGNRAFLGLLAAIKRAPFFLVTG